MRLLLFALLSFCLASLAVELKTELATRKFARRRPSPVAAEVAPVKTCGCPVSASCGDCCGKEHCRCSPAR